MWGLIFLALMIIGVCAKEKTWTHRLAVSVDLIACSVVWLKYDVTISSWCRVQQLAGKDGNKFGRALGWVLNKIQKDHCALAVQADIERAEAAMEFLAGADLAQQLAEWEKSVAIIKQQ
jgi:hypothetical protein